MEILAKGSNESRSFLRAESITGSSDIKENLRSLSGTAELDIIVAAHSESNMLLWNSGDSLSYGDFFGALPKNTAAVAVMGCEAGNAIGDVSKLPTGTILYPMVTANSPVRPDELEVASHMSLDPNSIGGSILSAQELFVNRLFSISPETIASRNKQLQRSNSAYTEEYASSDPYKLVPTEIAIGGNPPLIIDLKQKLVELSTSKRALPTAAKGYIAEILANDSGSEEYRKMVDGVIKKIESGQVNRPETLSPKELAVATALTVLTMNERGDLKKAVSLVKAKDQFDAAPGEPERGDSLNGTIPNLAVENERTR